MPLLTFTSDFGNSDHYVAYVKAALYSERSDLQLIDISHGIKPNDVSHMAFVVGSVFKEFPMGTIHFIGQDDELGYFIAFVDGHYFVTPNNGVISLVAERRPDLMISLPESNNTLKAAAQAAVKLVDGVPAEGLGTPLTNYKEFSKRKARATKREISGHVIHVDHFGNLITNIEKTDFDILSKERNYTIQFSREKLDRVQNQMKDVEPGDAFAKFDDMGRLVIGLYQGNGAQLLGLSFDSAVVINFEE